MTPKLTYGTSLYDGLSDVERGLFDGMYDSVFAETGDALKAELAAWGILRKKRLIQGMKSASGDVYRIGGWAVDFTDETNPDVDGQYFDALTTYLTDYYRNAPLWMNHGDDPRYGSLPIGRRVLTIIYRHGIWLEHELDLQHPHFEETAARVEAGELTYSTDSILHHVLNGYDDESGRLGWWALAGCSLTDTPAEPALGPVTLANVERDVLAVVKSARSGEREAQTSQMVTALKRRGLLAQETGQKSMDLNALAQFLGTEADAESIIAALQEVISKLSSGDPNAGASADTPPENKMSMPDMAQLRVALNLTPDAPDADVISALQALVAQLTGGDGMSADAETDAGKSTHAYDYAALAAAMKTAKDTGTDPIPHVVGAKSTTAIKRYNGGGRAMVKPTLATMINDMRAGKASTYQTGPLGGYIVQEQIRGEILPMLRAALIFEQLGALITPMPDFAMMQVPKMNAAPAAYWVGVNKTVPASDPQFGTLTLNPRLIASLTKIPIRLLETMPAEAERRIREEMVKSMRLEIERAAFYGTGAVTGSNNGSEPLGLINTPDVTSTTLATDGRKPTPADLVTAVMRVQADNVELDSSTHWAMHPNIKTYLDNLTDTTGQLINPAQVYQGFSAVPTTNISNAITTGASSNTSDIFLGRWNYLEFGMGQSIEVRVLNELYAAELQVGILAWTYCDILVHYPEAFEVLRGAKSA